MKVGVLTFHFPNNFGAVLQTFALEFFLKKRHHEVSIINYVPQESEVAPFFVKSLNVRHIIGNLIRLFLYPYFIKRKHLFQSFRKKNLSVSKNYCDKIISSFDAIITGSDQTFNLNYSYAKIYYQPFKKEPSQRKIAYAPSFGSYDISLLPTEMIEYLKDFDGLSCREPNCADFLSKMIGKTVYAVWDPVFLLSKKEWASMLNARPVREGYIFIYDLNGKDSLIKLALKIGGNKKIFVYSNDLMFQVRSENKSSVSFIKCLSVEDFLTYLYYADLVITDSFHGTAFSIIFEKQFNSFIALEKASTRIYAILESLGLMSRVIESGHIDDSQIDYRVVSNRLKKYIATSRGFLEKNDL